MIDPKELRIGNLINRLDLGDGHTRIETILGLGKRMIISGPIEVICDYEYISPIELTPEWLEKAGAQRALDNWGGWLIGDDTNDVRILRDENGFYHLTGSLYRREIRLPFLHKLQNFMFEYTGSELTFKQ